MDQGDINSNWLGLEALSHFPSLSIAIWLNSNKSPLVETPLPPVNFLGRGNQDMAMVRAMGSGPELDTVLFGNDGCASHGMLHAPGIVRLQ